MDIQAFQSQRALVEAFLTLKFQVEQKLARSDEKATEWMKLLMEDTLAQIKVCNIKMPLCFLPLDEVDFYSKPFASGNFGLVHRGELSSGDSVVVKFFRIDDTNLDGCSMLRIEKDMNELYYLDHPHVAKMCGGSHVGNPPYLVSEDTDEGNLASYLIRSTGRKKELWKLMHQTALGLEYLHKRGIVHGHLKLNNILVASNGDAKLSDFCLSTLRTCTKSSNDASSGLRWRALECLKGRPTFASDVYSFGMCIVEAVLGEPPLNFLDDGDVRDFIKSGGTVGRPECMDDNVWELVASMANPDPTMRVELNHVVKNLKEFAGTDAARMLRYTPVIECGECFSDNFAGSRFCSQCGIQISDNARLTADNRDHHENTTRALTIDTPIPRLVVCIQSGTVTEQEQTLGSLVQGCICSQKRALMYDAGALPLLIDLVKHGRTHFIQVSALACVRWQYLADSKGPVSEYLKLKDLVRAATPEECAAAVNILRNGTSCEKADALMYCTSIAAVKGYNELQMAGAIPALADLLKSGSDNEKIWSANAFGYFAEREDFYDEIARNGVISHLMAMLRTDCRLQKKAKIVFNAENRRVIVNAEVIPALVATLRNGADMDECALVLACLSLDEYNRDKLMDEDVTSAFVPILRTGTNSQKEYAARVFANMTAGLRYNDQITHGGVISPLVALLRDGTEKQKEYAACTVANLAANSDDRRDMIVREGAIPALVLLVRAGTADQKKRAVRAKANLAMNVGIERLSQMRGASTPLVELIRNNGTDFQKEQSMRVLACLSINDETRDVIRDSRVIALLVALLETGTEASKANAALALGNLAIGNNSYKTEVKNRGAIALLENLRQKGTTLQKRNAANALTILGKES